MKKSETLSFKVTEELKRNIAAAAKKENRSVSNWVQLVLEKASKKGKK